MENALLTRRGIHARRSFWDQCMHLRLTAAAIPTPSLQAPANGSCCWVIIHLSVSKELSMFFCDVSDVT